MGVRLFSEVLANFPAQRARALNASVGIDAVYANVWPNYDAPNPPVPQNNRKAFKQWKADAGVPVWGWMVCSADQDADAQKIHELTDELGVDGWKLNIEKVLEGKSLKVIAGAAEATGLPVSASLAGVSGAATPYDYRTLDNLGIEVDWQAYFDSGEGPAPADAVRELYQSSFVIPGWEYRARLGGAYGWGKVTRVEQGQLAMYDGYRRPGANDGGFVVTPREWGFTVVSRELRRAGQSVGMLMGRAAYPKIAVTLDVTRTAASRPPHEWTAIAASARYPNASKRPVAIYLAEVASDATIAAIAAGAA